MKSPKDWNQTPPWKKNKFVGRSARADPFYRPKPYPRWHTSPPSLIRNGMNPVPRTEAPMIYPVYENAIVRWKRPPWPKRPQMPKNMGHFAREKHWRLDIMHDTLAFLTARKWPWHPHLLNIRYEAPPNFQLPPCPHNLKTEFVVSNEDTLSAALRVIGSHSTPQWNSRLFTVPAVLNMAHPKVRGGGVFYGARAQEEDLCRRTDLWASLQKAPYPLPEFGCVYNYPVSILRNSKETNYAFLKTSCCDACHFPQIAVLTAASYEKPKINQTYRRNMAKKVDQLLTTAWASGHGTLILSAWGCGAFKNPPEDVAQIFYTALTTKFLNRFKTVIFALATNANDRHLDGCCKAFVRVFKTKMFRPENVDLDWDPYPVNVTPISSKMGDALPLDEATHRTLFVQKRPVEEEVEEEEEEEVVDDEETEEEEVEPHRKHSDEGRNDGSSILSPGAFVGKVMSLFK